MPTNTFHSFGSDDIIESVHVSEMHTPIQNLERGASYYAGTSTGSSTAYAVTMSPTPDSPHQSGMIVNFKAHLQNAAGAPDVTLNVSGVGAKPILKNGGQSLAAGDIKAGQVVSVVYDATGLGQFNLLATIPVASNLDSLSDVIVSGPSPGQVIQYNGTNFVNGNPMGFNLFGNVLGKLVCKRSLNSGSGTTDLGSPPSGKRWLIMQCYVVYPQGLTGTKTFTSGFKFSGSFVGNYQMTLSSNGSSLVPNQYYPILESTDTLSHNVSASGLSVFYEILEFSTSIGLKTAKLTNLANGNNVLYTCPAGKTAQLVSFYGLGNSLSFTGGDLVYFNNSGSARSVYWNLCRAGDTALAPGTGSNALTGYTNSVSSGAYSFNSFRFYGGLEAGDFVSFNTNSSASTQMLWANVQEF